MIQGVVPCQPAGFGPAGPEHVAPLVDVTGAHPVTSPIAGYVPAERRSLPDVAVGGTAGLVSTQPFTTGGLRQWSDRQLRGRTLALRDDIAPSVGPVGASLYTAGLSTIIPIVEPGPANYADVIDAV